MDICQIVFFQIMPYNGFLCLLKETVGKGVIMFRLGYYSLIAQNVILVYKSFGPWYNICRLRNSLAFAILPNCE